MSDPTLPQELALYDSMCRAIDAAYAVDEVKDIALAPARGELPRPISVSRDPTAPRPRARGAAPDQLSGRNYQAGCRCSAHVSCGAGWGQCCRSLIGRTARP